MAFTAKDVAQLREITGAGMMDCKKALVHTDGDMEKAIEYLRELGVSVANKKQGRIASEGAVCGYSTGSVCALAEVNCETDFVANTEGFQALATQVAKLAAELAPKSTEELIAAATEHTNAETQKCGEKIAVRRFERYALSGTGIEEYYIHGGGKIGVMLEAVTDKPVTDEIKTVIHNICLHIAAYSPQYLDASEIPGDFLEKEKQILLAQAKNDPKNANKPDAILEKMLQGRLKKSLEEICLNDQKFVMDESVTVSELIGGLSKKSGISIKLTKFARLVMGEGLEKKEDNLADEVAKMQGK